MTMMGTVRNGRVELEPGATLPEGARVRIEPVSQTPDPLEGIAEDAVATGISDLATQHDHYIYGTPKREP